MVVLAKGELKQIELPSVQRAAPPLAAVPEIDLALAAAGDAANGRAAAARAVAKACEEHGFFKVTDHGVPAPLLARVEAAAAAFFTLPQREKEKAAATVAPAGGGGSPFGYASKRIGGNGDLGWVEYLLLGVTTAGAAPVAFPAISFVCVRGGITLLFPRHCRIRLGADWREHLLPLQRCVRDREEETIGENVYFLYYYTLEYAGMLHPLYFRCYCAPRVTMMRTSLLCI